MKRTLLAAAIALASLTAGAAPPAATGPSVTIANTPLPVTESAIPFDDWGAGNSFVPLLCIHRKVNAFSPLEEKVCTSAPLLTPARYYVRSFSVSPFAIDPELDGYYRAASCALQLRLSIDGGQTFTRFPQFSWSPGDYRTSVYVLPVPLEIPAGVSLVRQVDVEMAMGNAGQGCAAWTRVQVTTR